MNLPVSIPRPSWLTLPRLALAGIFVIIAVVVWPKSGHPPDPAVENGYRVARRLPSLRRETAARLRAYEAETLQTNAASRNARATLRTLRTVAAAPLPEPAHVLASLPDSVVVVGHPQVGDTLVLLSVVRERMQYVVDTAEALVTNLIGRVEIERGRVSLVMQSYQRTIAAQDTVIAGLRAELQRKGRPWYIRASHGVEALGVGSACGGLGYIAFGPLGALGAAVACAAIDGMVR